MTRLLSFNDFDLLLRNLAGSGSVRGPIALPGRGRFSDTDLVKYSDISSVNQLVWDKKTYLSAKDAVLPITQTMFRFVNGEAIEPVEENGKLVLICRSCDMHALSRLDNIFLRNGTDPDPYYKKLRDRLILVLMECAEPFESCFCVTMGTNRYSEYDAIIRKTDDGILIEGRTVTFTPALATLGKEHPFTPIFPEHNGTEVTLPLVNAMTPELFVSPFWEEYSKRCIACGRCNTSCPTCSCYRVFDTNHDVQSGAFAERKRVWDGCHLDGFTDMAGGAVVRKEYGSRMRFKTFHKIYDYRKRFGVNMCVGCGRCDDVCPEYISFANCISKLSQLCSEGGKTNV